MGLQSISKCVIFGTFFSLSLDYELILWCMRCVRHLWWQNICNLGMKNGWICKGVGIQTQCISEIRKDSQKHHFFLLFRMFTSLETNLFSMVGYSHTHKRMFIPTMQVGQSRPPGGGNPSGRGMLALFLNCYSLI